jgi:hypothetical protein
MNKFNKGDVVVCIEPIDKMVRGRKYVVTGHDGVDQVGIEGLVNGKIGWNDRRFVLDESETAKRILLSYEV